MVSSSTFIIPVCSTRLRGFTTGFSCLLELNLLQGRSPKQTNCFTTGVKDSAFRSGGTIVEHPEVAAVYLRSSKIVLFNSLMKR